MVLVQYEGTLYLLDPLAILEDAKHKKKRTDCSHKESPLSISTSEKEKKKKKTTATENYSLPLFHAYP